MHGTAVNYGCKWKVIPHAHFHGYEVAVSGVDIESHHELGSDEHLGFLHLDQTELGVAAGCACSADP